MLGDGVISLGETTREEIPAIVRMEADDDAAAFVTQETAEQHARNLDDPGLVYRSIYDERGALIGFVYLALDPDAVSVELRRIVVGPKGKGYGQRAMALAERVCREEIGRRRIWLDVFDFNTRAQRVYERCQYRQFGKGDLDGRPLLFYEKRV